jgi:MFS family permease
MFLVMAVPAVLYGALAFTIPESPRYLVASHQIPEARRVLSTLLGKKNLEITITRIRDTWSGRTSRRGGDMRKPTGGIYGIVWVGLGLSIFQQFVGINVIFYLLERAVAGRGIQRRRVGDLHRDHLGDQRAHHPHRDRTDRQGGPQAAAAGRLRPAWRSR